MIRVACVSDVHAPKNFEVFKEALKKLEAEEIDLFLFAGDMIYKGKIDEIQKILALLESISIKFPIYACFGNEEFDQLYDQLRKISEGKIVYLNDEAAIIQRKEYKIGIIGTKGSLAEPTSWQIKNIPKIREQYINRVSSIEKLVSFQFTKEVNLRILLMHYAPTYLTLAGENKMFYSRLGDPSYEKIILNPSFKFDVVFHGHAHNGLKFVLLKNTVPIYNVAIPLRKEVTIINLPRPPSRGSLLSYLK